MNQVRVWYQQPAKRVKQAGRSRLAGGCSVRRAVGSRVEMAALVEALDTVISRERKRKKRRVMIDQSIETPKHQENTKKTSSVPCAAVSCCLPPARLYWPSESPGNQTTAGLHRDRVMCGIGLQDQSWL